METFRYDSHPMGMLIAYVPSASLFAHAERAILVAHPPPPSDCVRLRVNAQDDCKLIHGAPGRQPSDPRPQPLQLADRSQQADLPAARQGPDHRRRRLPPPERPVCGSLAPHFVLGSARPDHLNVCARASTVRAHRPYNPPQAHLDYTENFLYMLDRLAEVDFRPDPRIVRALDRMFIIHAEHASATSTAGVRHLASTGVDPYTIVSGASLCVCTRA